MKTAIATLLLAAAMQYTLAYLGIMPPLGYSVWLSNSMGTDFAEVGKLLCQ